MTGEIFEKDWKECEAKDHIGEPYTNHGKGNWHMDDLGGKLICPKCATRKKHIVRFWDAWFTTTLKIKRKEKLSKQDIKEVIEEVTNGL